MRTHWLATMEFATEGGAKTGIGFPDLGIISPLQVAINDVLKIAHPRKTWAFLANLLGLTERVAKHRLAASRAYTIEELQAMLQSENGFEILQVLMAQSEPKWWWWAKRVIATAERRRQAAELDQEILQLETSRPPDVSGRRRIKGDLDARTALGKAFARKETALAFLRPDVDRPVAGAVAQAQAQSKGRGR
jgi:hypothetical protein